VDDDPQALVTAQAYGAWFYIEPPVAGDSWVSIEGRLFK